MDLSRGRAWETEREGGSRGAWPPAPLPRSFLRISVRLGLSERRLVASVLLCCWPAGVPSAGGIQRCPLGSPCLAPVRAVGMPSMGGRGCRLCCAWLGEGRPRLGSVSDLGAEQP